MRASVLDYRHRPILNHRVRAVVLWFVVLASATALAKPRVQVAPFSVHGDALGLLRARGARAIDGRARG